MATAESLNLTETIDNKRYYNITDNDNIRRKLPSVTTILGAMTDHSALDDWRTRVGEAEADRISTFSANRGTCMHQKLEYWFTSDIPDTTARIAAVNKKMAGFIKENGYTEEELRCGDGLFNSLYICGFFKKVAEIVEMENTLFSLEQGGYAGRVDCVYKDNDGKLVLLDFKTSRRKKKREWISNYFMQLSAYWLAYYQMHGVLLDRAELWIAVENDIPQCIEISREELKFWLRQFLGLVREYHAKYDYLLSGNEQEKNIVTDEKPKKKSVTVISEKKFDEFARMYGVSNEQFHYICEKYSNFAKPKYGVLAALSEMTYFDICLLCMRDRSSVRYVELPAEYLAKVNKERHCDAIVDIDDGDDSDLAGVDLKYAVDEYVYIKKSEEKIKQLKYIAVAEDYLWQTDEFWGGGNLHVKLFEKKYIISLAESTGDFYRVHVSKLKYDYAPIYAGWKNSSLFDSKVNGKKYTANEAVTMHNYVLSEKKNDPDVIVEKNEDDIRRFIFDVIYSIKKAGVKYKISDESVRDFITDFINKLKKIT